MSGTLAAVLLLAGICQGSFGLGYKDYRPFGWALFWQIYNVFCLLVALIWAASHVPGLWGYYGAYPQETVVVLCCGIIWGASAICFTKGIDLLGMALLYGISMGISSVGGAVLPLLVREGGAAGTDLKMLLAGLVLSGFGILAITAGGILREKENRGENRGEKQAAPFQNTAVLGILLAVCSGAGSALMNLGFGYGVETSQAMAAAGVGDMGLAAAPWLLVVIGGILAASCYCLPKIRKEKLLFGLPGKASAKTILKLGLTSVVWYMALALYGVFTRQAGPNGLVSGWVIFNALALIVSNFWGIAAGEWKGAQKPLRWVLAGDGIMILSWIFLAGI